MRIVQLDVKNYRGFGPKGQTVIFGENRTTVVGANNAGKSSIIKAIKELLTNGTVWNDENYYRGQDTLEIELKLKIDSAEYNELFEAFPFIGSFEELRRERLHKWLSNDELIIRLIKKKYRSAVLVQLGRVGFSETYDPRLFGVGAIEYAKVILPIADGSTENQTEVRRAKSGEGIITGVDVKPIIEIVRKWIVIVDEFRGRPASDVSQATVSETGRELAGVLFTMKNESKYKKEYRQIQEKFHDIFPSKQLDADRRGSEYLISIEGPEGNSTTQYIGSGVLEIIQILTHIFGHKDKPVIIDEPEAHIHPHTQRVLAEAIGKRDGQTVLITHSPQFVEIGPKESALSVRYLGEILCQPHDPAVFTENFERDSIHYDYSVREIAFCQKVILVEGASERVALPILFKALEYDLDMHDVGIVNMQSADASEKFVRVSNWFRRPSLLVLDKNKEAWVTKLQEKKLNFTPFIVQKNDFNDLFTKEQKGDGNKPEQALRAAKWLEKNPTKIPDEIRELLKKVKELS